MNESIFGLDDDMEPHFDLFDPHWRLSGHDADILDDLKEVIRWWMPALTKTDDLAAAVDMLRALDGVVDGSAPNYITEFSVRRIEPSRGGVSASITVAPGEIALGCNEWVPNVNGGQDHGSLLFRDGRPMGMTLDTRGSFDRESFDEWWHLALTTGPQEPRDQRVHGTMRVEE